MEEQRPGPNDTNQENSAEGTRPDANPWPAIAALPVDRLLVRRTARKGAGALEYTSISLPVILDFHND
jgi:hypothetical protein